MTTTNRPYKHHCHNNCPSSHKDRHSYLLRPSTEGRLDKISSPCSRHVQKRMTAMWNKRTQTVNYLLRNSISLAMSLPQSPLLTTSAKKKLTVTTSHRLSATSNSSSSSGTLSSVAKKSRMTELYDSLNFKVCSMFIMDYLTLSLIRINNQKAEPH